MRDSTIITRADVYAEEIPGTSDGVMMSGNSSPSLQPSMPLIDYDMPDEARPGKIISTTQTTPTTPTTPTATKPSSPDIETETIEKAVSIGHTVLLVSQADPKIKTNGFDLEVEEPVTQLEDDSCVVDCIYFTQQCCECVIL